MQRNPRSVIALIIGCLVLAGFAAFEHAPHQVQDHLHVHAMHAPTRSP
jgi:hypothetical protein